MIWAWSAINCLLSNSRMYVDYPRLLLRARIDTKTKVHSRLKEFNPGIRLIGADKNGIAGSEVVHVQIACIPDHHPTGHDLIQLFQMSDELKIYDTGIAPPAKFD